MVCGLCRGLAWAVSWHLLCFKGEKSLGVRALRGDKGEREIEETGVWETPSSGSGSQQLLDNKIEAVSPLPSFPLPFRGRDRKERELLCLYVSVVGVNVDFWACGHLWCGWLACHILFWSWMWC